MEFLRWQPLLLLAIRFPASQAVFGHNLTLRPRRNFGAVHSAEILRLVWSARSKHSAIFYQLRFARFWAASFEATLPAWNAVFLSTPPVRAGSRGFVQRIFPPTPLRAAEARYFLLIH